MPKEGLLTANDVAGYLRCSVSTVRRLVVRAEIPHIRVSKLIRFRRSDTGKLDYVHTLNGSGLATPRLVVALIETYQTSSGTIQFPDPVADFLGIEEIK